MIAQSQHHEQRGITEILHTKVAQPRVRVPFVQCEALLKRLHQAAEEHSLRVERSAPIRCRLPSTPTGTQALSELAQMFLHAEFERVPLSR